MSTVANKIKFYEDEEQIDFLNNPNLMKYNLGVITDFYSSDFEEFFDLKKDPKLYREELVASSFNIKDYPEIHDMVSVIANKDFLTNVGISGDRIYPITDLQYRKVLLEGFTKCEKCGFVVRDDDIWCEDNGIYLCEDCHNSHEED